MWPATPSSNPKRENSRKAPASRCLRCCRSSAKVAKVRRCGQVQRVLRGYGHERLRVQHSATIAPSCFFRQRPAEELGRRSVRRMLRRKRRQSASPNSIEPPTPPRSKAFPDSSSSTTTENTASRALLTFVKRLQCEAAANLRSGANRRGKTNPIQSIVHGHANAMLNLQRLLRQMAQQRKRQKTVRDGCAA